MAQQPARGNHGTLYDVLVCLPLDQGGDQSGILMGSWMVANRLGLRLLTVYIINEKVKMAYIYIYVYILYTA